ncbi:hypothetical protein PLICRDRAFT_244124 [Plicaturopsis crispa FD-325 SS-3]|nr:hypothetical protein PLICRDRAFT_244124 [Plicaturopsis crispa FD-325 SS-3]
MILGKAVNYTVGLAAELKAAQKKKPATPPPNERAPPDEAELDDDEDDWELDDAEPADQVEPPKKEGVTKFSAPPPPAERPPIGTLPLPVILPQRRPRNKMRGFVRAWAPDLAACDVREEDFLRFVSEFHLAMQASKAFKVMQLGAFVAGCIPSVTAQAVSMAVNIAAGVGSAIQTHYQGNAFLDNANEVYFHPRGLHATVFTFKPSEASNFGISVVNVDLSSYFDKILPKKLVEKRKATTSAEVPESAPLVYPNVQEIPEGGFFKRMGETILDYNDRRAQQQFINENPGNSLAGPTPQFASEFGRPSESSRRGLLGGGILGRGGSPLGGGSGRGGGRLGGGLLGRGAGLGGGLLGTLASRGQHQPPSQQYGEQQHGGQQYAGDYQHRDGQHYGGQQHSEYAEQQYGGGQDPRGRLSGRRSAAGQYGDEAYSTGAAGPGFGGLVGHRIGRGFGGSRLMSLGAIPPQQGYPPEGPQGHQQQSGSGAGVRAQAPPIGIEGIKRLLRENTLYLLVAELPAESRAQV